MTILKETNNSTVIFKNPKELSEFLKKRVIKRVGAPTHQMADNQIAFQTTDFNGPWSFKYEGPSFWFRKKDMCVTVMTSQMLSLTLHWKGTPDEVVYIYTQSGALLVVELK